MPDLPNPFIVAKSDFPRGFDVAAFMDAVEPAPLFLSDPSPEYMTATEIVPVLAVLAKY